MSDKLTGREAVKALMDGKKIFRTATYLGSNHTYRMQIDVSGDKETVVWTSGDYSPKPFSLDHVIVHNDWEIVQEPMVWEDDQTVGTQFFSKQLTVSGSLVASECKEVQVVYVPDSFKEKRVKVRVEEVLE